MAKYSYDKYGNFIYGVTNPDTSPYYQSKITAESVDYKSIEIKWEPINPDPLIGVPTYWALSKSSKKIMRMLKKLLKNCYFF